jgi:hypothetical protein
MHGAKFAAIELWKILFICERRKFPHFSLNFYYFLPYTRVVFLCKYFTIHLARRFAVQPLPRFYSNVAKQTTTTNHHRNVQMARGAMECTEEE